MNRSVANENKIIENYFSDSILITEKTWLKMV